MIRATEKDCEVFNQPELFGQEQFEFAQNSLLIIIINKYPTVKHEWMSMKTSNLVVIIYYTNHKLFMYTRKCNS